MQRGVLSLLALAFLVAGAPRADAQKYQISRTTLANGLDVIVVHNPSVPLVTVEIDVHNGAYTEAPEYNGLSHLYEHMFFKANHAIPSQEKYMARLRELGASWNGTTGDERVNYFFTVPRDSLVPALVFMYNAITGPLFLQEELVRERSVVTGEYDRAESNPYFLLNRAVDTLVWWKYFTRKNALGERHVILTATTAKMQAIEDRYYIPNNAALILAGDITPEEGFRLAKEHFGSWKRGPDPFTAFPVPPHPPIRRSETTVLDAPVNAVTIMMKWQGPSVRKDPEATYAADVLSFILSQKTSRFYIDLVESGLLYAANLNYQTEDQTGPITLFAQTSAGNFAKAKAAIAAELQKMEEPGYFTDEQLRNAKTILSIDGKYERERPSLFSHTVGYWWAIAGLDYYLGYDDHLQKVTAGDITKYLKDYVEGKPCITGILASARDRKTIGL